MSYTKKFKKQAIEFENERPVKNNLHFEKN